MESVCGAVKQNIEILQHGPLGHGPLGYGPLQSKKGLRL